MPVKNDAHDLFGDSWPRLSWEDLGERGRRAPVLHGDVRDDIRAALSCGSDAISELRVVEYALSAIGDEESAVPSEERQEAMAAATRLLHERIQRLSVVSRYFWDCAIAKGI